MNRLPLPDAGYLRSILNYDPETGVFTWQHRVTAHQSTNTRCARTVAGTTTGQGYVSICIDQLRFKAHRLAWYFVTGNDPSSDIDHIDCDRSNNRFANLRIATNQQNHWNMPKSRSNTSGHKGVYWSTHAGRWRASITVSGKMTNLGYFHNIKAAADAYKCAAVKHFGEFARIK